MYHHNGASRAQVHHRVCSVGGLQLVRGVSEVCTYLIRLTIERLTDVHNGQNHAISADSMQHIFFSLTMCAMTRSATNVPIPWYYPYNPGILVFYFDTNK
jgi:hypothetical protein